MGEMVGKPEGERLFGRPKNRPENSIKMNLKGVGPEGVNWINLAQDGNQWRLLVNT
jgi:hypothetical protein